MKQVTNFQLLIFLLVLCTSYLSAQTNWNGGGGDTAWDNPLNWTAGVPDATDHVTIPVGAIVVISTPALAKSVANQGELTIQMNSSLTIEGSTSNGIHNQGLISNEGDLHINNTGTYGINNPSIGTFHNAGDIHIDNAGNRAIDNRGNFINNHNINIGQNGGPGNITYDGIINYSVFNNNGNLTIDNVGESGISNWVGGNFTNTNTINIGQNGGVGNILRDGISNGFGDVANFTNSSGIINIDNTGINAFASFSASLVQNLAGGQMNFGINSGNIGHHGIYNSGSTFNNDASQINIANTLSQDGIENRNGGTFNNINGATLNIGQVGGPGNVKAYGILNDASFNHSGGVINIDNTSFSALRNSTGTFTNSAELNIGQNGGPGNHVNGIFNQSTFIHNGGVINIDNSQFQGILNNPGTFTNNSNINIGQNAGSIGHSGIYQSVGSFTNDGGTINIDNIGINSGGADGLFCTAQGEFKNLNGGQVAIGQNSSLPSEGISCGNSAKLINDASTITIDNAARFALELWSNGEFENKNSALCLIGQNYGNIGSSGIQTWYGVANISNNSGAEIRIDNTGTNGINNTNGIFTNSATINIGKNAGNIGHSAIYQPGGSFTNDGGTIDIDNVILFEGIHLANSTFENKNNGQILIGQVNGVGRIGLYTGNATFINNGSTVKIDNVGIQSLPRGIQCQSSSTVTNQNGGQILIGQLGPSNLSNGIILFSSNFTNDGSTVKVDYANHDAISTNDMTLENKNGGEILIGQTGPIGRMGIFLFYNATFINDGSTIRIDNSQHGYWSQGTNTATNKNGGQIYIDQNGLIANNGFTNSGGNVFNNLDCSEIYLYKNLINSGVINNAGLLSINTSQSHANSGTFTNNGIIEIIQLPEVPNVINNDLIIAPINGFCFIDDALQIGGMNSFTSLTQWYFDQSLSNPAGDYDQSANELSLFNLNNGVHTLYFTVAGNGCNFPVSIQLTVDEVQVNKTDESCDGMADGSVNLTIQSSNGQVGYSIDGGVNFQFNGQFNNLSAGTYNWVVKVFGTTNNCEKTGMVTIASGAPAPTWWLDADNDGYSNGTTLTSCTQPAGYIADPLTGTDCNDSDPAINPGATETCDGLDNDCDGIIPAGETDADGDGYMLCEGDCNDTDAAVNPGATEICNGIDDDCDGEIDEGVGSGLTWTGNVTFTTQAEVDAWLACYSIIDGNLTIMGGGITDLSNLISLEEVTGLVFIYANGSLTTLNGLDNLATVGNGLSIYYNFALADCCAISDLLENGGVTGMIMIFANAAGCNSQSEIIAECGGNSLVSAPNSGTDTADGFEVKGGKIGTGIVLYPNPTSGKFTVIVPNGLNEGKLTLMDLQGRAMQVQALNSGQVSYLFNSHQLPSGIYIMMIQAAGQPKQAVRLVVE